MENAFPLSSPSFNIHDNSKDDLSQTCTHTHTLFCYCHSLNHYDSHVMVYIVCHMKLILFQNVSLSLSLTVTLTHTHTNMLFYHFHYYDSHVMMHTITHTRTHFYHSHSLRHYDACHVKLTLFQNLSSTGNSNTHTHAANVCACAHTHTHTHICTHTEIYGTQMLPHILVSIILMHNE